MKDCTDKEWKHCRVEKMGCKGCNYDDKEEEKKEACSMKNYGSTQKGI